MLQLSAPIWLFTAMAMLAPLLIHLWNIRKGRRLKVGSLSLLSEAVQKKARQVRITEWLLLLVRCLLILLLAFFLAGPAWKQRPAREGKGWVLVPEEALHTVYPVFREEIDSLLKAGYEFHYFNYPFRKADPTDVGIDTTARLASYWQRLAQLNAMLPERWPVYIYTPADIPHFAGNKPETALSVHWKPAPAIAAPSQKQQSSQPLHVTLYHDQAHSEDARYVNAALLALQSQLPDIIVELTAEPVRTGGQDIVFWLSEKKPDYIDTAAIYISYVGGNTAPGNSPLITNKPVSGAADARVYKRIIAKDTASMVLWKDGYGNALLDRDSSGRQLHLYTRFDPAWTSLVWDASFPQWIDELIRQHIVDDIGGRQVDITQLSFTPVAGQQHVHNGEIIPLDKYVWWLMLALMVLERWLSLKRRPDAA